MDYPIYYTAGQTSAIGHATEILKRFGCQFSQEADCSVTRLLLGVPSFAPDGSLNGGGVLADILPNFSKRVTVFGGNLDCPQLSEYEKVDLLKDPFYLADNANITAHCAMQLAQEKLPVILEGCQVLIIGWGRIGKCLARLLRQTGAIVTVAARKESDRATLRALGYDIEDSTALSYSLLRYRVIFNTVPANVLPAEAAAHCRPDCLKIDLASSPGMEGDDVLWARGLPGKMAPESSGELIAKSILRHR